MLRFSPTLPSPAVMSSARVDRYCDHLRCPASTRTTSRLRARYRTRPSGTTAGRFDLAGLPCFTVTLRAFRGIHREQPGSARLDVLTLLVLPPRAMLEQMDPDAR